MDTGVTSITETHKLGPKYKLCFPSTAFWGAPLGANVVAINLFLAVLSEKFGNEPRVP
jgi:hypothetical protein